MDATGLIVSTTCIAASAPVAAVAVRSYRAFGGARFVTCPETAAEAVVKIKVARAVAGQLTGSGHLPLRSCSRWPEKKDCAQSCSLQISASPNGCRRRVQPSRARQTPAPGWSSEHFVGVGGRPSLPSAGPSKA